MKAWLIIFFFIPSIKSIGQLSFKTIAPQQPVVAGESFQVQYILQDAQKAGVMTAPSFKGFRFVSGPNIYFGTAYGKQPMQNLVYTLEALKPGVYIIPGATVPVNGKMIRSNDTQVEVISKEEALKDYLKQYNSQSSEYFLKPGEDPYKKIRDNLFVRVMVDKRTCMVGEPVLATFKLYSRLESKSDIVKNPGLYGFTVYDMVNLSDREVVNEKINGKDFDVHTIRKVQLYPLQAGDFTIDPLEVKNRVEFSVSAVDKHTEQEIVEGMLGNNDPGVHPPGTEIFETSIATPAVKIHVNALPEKNKPPSFTGAVGNFRIKASVSKAGIAKNEQDFLELIISGTGNFIQVDAPEVKWPEGIESFQPKLQDQLDKMNMPLRGSRTFIFPFVALSGGQYQVPPVSFSFFDPDSNRYRVVQTEPMLIDVSSQNTVSAVPASKKRSGNYLVFLITVLVVVITAAYIFIKRKHRVAVVVPDKQNETEEPGLDVDITEPGFYSAIYHALWQAVSKKFALHGSKMNKEILKLVMKANSVSPATIDELIGLISYCETRMFTGTVPDENENDLPEKARRMLGVLASL